MLKRLKSTALKPKITKRRRAYKLIANEEIGPASEKTAYILQSLRGSYLILKGF